MTTKIENLTMVGDIFDVYIRYDTFHADCPWTVSILNHGEEFCEEHPSRNTLTYRTYMTRWGARRAAKSWCKMVVARTESQRRSPKKYQEKWTYSREPR